MEIQELLKKPLFQLTTEEFLFISNKDSQSVNITPESATPNKRYVYGLVGIATLFDCSRATASRLKKSKKIDAAISQIGRKIIVDAELALKLAKIKIGVSK